MIRTPYIGAQLSIKVNQRGYTELVADRDGIVTAINAEAGQVVSPGQAVLTVAADGEREVVISIAESRVDELRRAKSLQVSAGARFLSTLHVARPEGAPGVHRQGGCGCRPRFSAARRSR